MPTIKASFGGRIPLVYLDQGTSIPLSFVLQLPDKLRPSYIRDGLSKLMVLDHILDLQTLDAYDLVFTYDLCRELVLIVTSSIGYTCMNTSNLQLSFSSVLRAFFLLGMPSLSLSQLLLVFGKEFRITERMTIGGDNHALESQVKPYLFVNDRQGLNVFLYQDRDKVAISAIFANGDTGRFTLFGQGTRPMSVKGSRGRPRSEPVCLSRSCPKGRT